MSGSPPQRQQSQDLTQRSRAGQARAQNGSHPAAGGRGRSHLLRRSQRHRPDPPTLNNPRIRRERRVYGPFSGIPDLARNGTS
jgi:hypothetical protein